MSEPETTDWSERFAPHSDLPAAMDSPAVERPRRAIAELDGENKSTPEDIVPVPRPTWDALQVRCYEMAERLDNAERRLRQLGYVRCDMIACNCKGYHFNGES